MGQKEVKSVAYCGGMTPEDYKVAKSLYPAVHLEPCANYKKTYDAVASGECDVAVIPFEKGASGDIGVVLNLMFEGDLFINKVINWDTPSDTVRYAVFSREENTEPLEGTGNFLMMFTVKDETGCLARAINVISDHGFNMSIMRSNKRKGLPWNYYFFVEAQGDYLAGEGPAMVKELTEACETLKIFGRYE